MSIAEIMKLQRAQGAEGDSQETSNTRKKRARDQSHDRDMINGYNKHGLRRREDGDDDDDEDNNSDNENGNNGGGQEGAPQPAPATLWKSVPLRAGLYRYNHP